MLGPKSSPCLPLVGREELEVVERRKRTEMFLKLRLGQAGRETPDHHLHTNNNRSNDPKTTPKDLAQRNHPAECKHISPGDMIQSVLQCAVNKVPYISLLTLADHI